MKECSDDLCRDRLYSYFPFVSEDTRREDSWIVFAERGFMGEEESERVGGCERVSPWPSCFFFGGLLGCWRCTECECFVASVFVVWREWIG